MGSFSYGARTMSKLSIWISVGVLFAYFVFSSGLFYWASGCQETKKLVTPFSWALSAEDTGLTGVATENDLDCVYWLANESDQSLEIACDSNALFLLSGYIELIPLAWEQYGRYDRLVMMMEMPKKKECYLFLTEWNIKHGKYITCTEVGLRRQNPFRIEGDNIVYSVYDMEKPWIIYEENAQIEEVYRSGKSVVYIKCLKKPQIAQIQGLSDK